MDCVWILVDQYATSADISSMERSYSGGSWMAYTPMSNPSWRKSKPVVIDVYKRLKKANRLTHPYDCLSYVCLYPKKYFQTQLKRVEEE